MQIKYGYRQIDLSTWKRGEHFKVFSQGEYPYVGLTTPVEVTRLLEACKAREIRFFNAFLYVAMRAMNAVENFRYRIFEDQVILLDAADPSFNVMDKERELFYFAYAPYTRDFAAFDAGVENAKDVALRSHNLAGNRLDVVYVSCLPWFGFTDIIQPMGLSANDTIPRLVWGKYDENETRITVPFSLTGHHGLFDGLHVSKLLDTMRVLLDDPDKFLPVSVPAQKNA